MQLLRDLPRRRRWSSVTTRMRGASRVFLFPEGRLRQVCHEFALVYICVPRKVTTMKYPVFCFVLVLTCAASAQTAGWRQLFNGKDLTGWKHVGPGEMTVEDGMIRTHGGMGLLYWTGGKLGNCAIRVQYQMRDHD